jgi:tRNA (guanine37-N1)-methyltransferase
MQFDIITIFPKIFKSYFSESILARAQKKRLVKINIHDLRKYTSDRHRTVDDTPYGGGAGMVIKIEPIYKALIKIVGKGKLKCFRNKTGNWKLETGNNSKKDNKIKIILLSAKGKKFDQAMARKFSKLDKIILICGRYEGVDERVAKYLADEEISIGDYILTGGEIPAMIIVDSVSRLIPGVVGKEESIQNDSFKKIVKEVPSSKFQVLRYLEHPHYTKPEVFSPDGKMEWKVPKVLLSGNHKKVLEWREKHSQTSKI